MIQIPQSRMEYYLYIGIMMGQKYMEFRVMHHDILSNQPRNQIGTSLVLMDRPYQLYNQVPVCTYLKNVSPLLSHLYPIRVLTLYLENPCSVIYSTWTGVQLVPHQHWLTQNLPQQFTVWSGMLVLNKTGWFIVFVWLWRGHVLFPTHSTLQHCSKYSAGRTSYFS